MTLDVGPAYLVLSHEDVEGGLWASLRLTPSFFCHWPFFGLFGLIIRRLLKLKHYPYYFIFQSLI
jgi:hypothetical protein